MNADLTNHERICADQVPTSVRTPNMHWSKLSDCRNTYESDETWSPKVSMGVIICSRYRSSKDQRKTRMNHRQSEMRGLAIVHFTHESIDHKICWSGEHTSQNPKAWSTSNRSIKLNITIKCTKVCHQLQVLFSRKERKS